MRWAELFGILSLRPISESEKPRFARARHSSTESARSIDGTEYSFCFATKDLNGERGSPSNQVDGSMDILKIRLTGQLRQLKKDRLCPFHKMASSQLDGT
jgi:hypothetical protein